MSESGSAPSKERSDAREVSLRERCQELSAEHWSVRDEQSERVAVAQLVLAMARREAEIAAHEKAETRLCGRLVGAHWRDGLDAGAVEALDEFLTWATGPGSRGVGCE